jgi:hypothetical protein
VDCRKLGDALKNDVKQCRLLGQTKRTEPLGHVFAPKSGRAPHIAHRTPRLSVRIVVAGTAQGEQPLPFRKGE